MKRCQTVYVGVVDVGSLPEQRCHLLPVPGRAGGHKHGSLGEADPRPAAPTAPRRFPRLRARPVRLRAQPSLHLVLPSLLGSFGPGMVSGRHLPWSDSAHGTRSSGVVGRGLTLPGAAPPGGRAPEAARELLGELFLWWCVQGSLGKISVSRGFVFFFDTARFAPYFHLCVIQRNSF